MPGSIGVEGKQQKKSKNYTKNALHVADNAMIEGACIHREARTSSFKSNPNPRCGFQESIWVIHVCIKLLQHIIPEIFCSALALMYLLFKFYTC
jgi:hypothetical protein